MKIADRLNQIDECRSIFIRGGESGFMIYCVKTEMRSPMCVAEPWVFTPRGVGCL